MLKPATTDLDALRILEERLRWLSAWTIHHANHIRPSPDGLKVGGHQASCTSMTAIMAALEKVPISRIGHRTPAVLFSRLLPGAHIPPHHGMLNSRLICHLPLIIPAGCWLRVGNETREWEEGKLLIFDDSIEHEARNPSGETRIILLFDVWKPELGEDERAAISDIFEAIDAYSGASDD